MSRVRLTRRGFWQGACSNCQQHTRDGSEDWEDSWKDNFSPGGCSALWRRCSAWALRSTRNKPRRRDNRLISKTLISKTTISKANISRRNLQPRRPHNSPRRQHPMNQLRPRRRNRLRLRRRLEHSRDRRQARLQRVARMEIPLLRRSRNLRHRPTHRPTMERHSNPLLRRQPPVRKAGQQRRPMEFKHSAAPS